MLGLVLSGGKGRRMGRDKGSIIYHGKSQRSYCYDLLARHCESVYVSCRKEQARLLRRSQNRIEDQKFFQELGGPGVGLLSAHEFSPSSAWLVLACDMPFVDDSVIERLLEGRNPSRCATAFLGPEDRRPEPLLAIWEPRGLELFQEGASRGRTSLREALESLDCEFLEPPSRKSLININTREDLKQAAGYL